MILKLLISTLLCIASTSFSMNPNDAPLKKNLAERPIRKEYKKRPDGKLTKRNEELTSAVKFMFNQEKKPALAPLKKKSNSKTKRKPTKPTQSKLEPLTNTRHSLKWKGSKFDPVAHKEINPENSAIPASTLEMQEKYPIIIPDIIQKQVPSTLSPIELSPLEDPAYFVTKEDWNAFKNLLDEDTPLEKTVDVHKKQPLPKKYHTRVKRAKRLIEHLPTDTKNETFKKPAENTTVVQDALRLLKENKLSLPSIQLVLLKPENLKRSHVSKKDMKEGEDTPPLSPQLEPHDITQEKWEAFRERVLEN